MRFTDSLRFSIEHGHANDQSNDYTSVAYWYQTEGLQTELRGSPVTVTSLMHGPVDTTFFARAGMSTTVLGRARKADPNDVARHLSLGKIALWLEPSRWSGETPQLATTRHPYG